MQDVVLAEVHKEDAAGYMLGKEGTQTPLKGSPLYTLENQSSLPVSVFPFSLL
jgi:hypothetical protein